MGSLSRINRRRQAVLRIITFEDGADRARAEKRFEMLYEGLHYGGAEATRKNGFNDVRAEAGVIRKLKAVSEEKTGAQPLASGEPSRALLAGAQDVTLTQTEHAILKEYFERTRWKVSASVDAVDAVDFLDAAAEKSEG